MASPDLNNREIAIIVWAVLALIAILSIGDVRKQFLALIRLLSSKPVIIILCLVSVYIYLTLNLLQTFYLWDLSLLKDVFSWWVTSGVVVLFNFPKAHKRDDYFSSIVKQTFAGYIFIEFLTEYFVFDFIIEFISLPIIIFISLLAAYSSTNSKYRPVEKLMNIVLFGFGAVLVVHSINMLLHNSYIFFNLQTMRQFILPVLLTLLFLPCVYLISLYSAYEELFIRTNYLLKSNNELLGFLKRRTILFANFQLRKLLSVSNTISKYANSMKTEEDVVNYLSKLKKKEIS